MMHIDFNGELKRSSRNNGNTVLSAGQKPRTLKRYFVVVSNRGVVGYWSIAGTKAESIKKFMEDSTMTWAQVKAYGWRCIKVDVQFLPCT